MDSEEEKSRSNRKGKHKSWNSKKGKKGKKGKPKSHDTLALKEADRATPTSSDINRCNEAFWKRNCSDEAEMVFKNNKETKREVVNKVFCSSLWPDKDFDWVYSGSNGASGGLITIWKKSIFSLDCHWGVPGALSIKGTWLGDTRKFTLINTYAPSGTKDQLSLWEDIQDRTSGLQEEAWCICGDFNTVTNQSERKGSNMLTSDKKSSNSVSSSKTLTLLIFLC
ncbi:hypothetical protein ACS0TY_024935 [Phlomoides rotata]